MSIDQEDLWTEPFVRIVASGRRFFRTPYFTDDGYGEGADGPSRRYQKLYQRNLPNNSFSFLRLNGLDSQSCFECQNTIGTAVLDDSASNQPDAWIRKIGVNGGSAGFASNACTNDDFGREGHRDEPVKFIRNPPSALCGGIADTPTRT